jgi:hypothetical protein
MTRVRVLHVVQNLNNGGMERLLGEIVRLADPAGSSRTSSCCSTWGGSPTAWSDMQLYISAIPFRPGRCSGEADRSSPCAASHRTSCTAIVAFGKRFPSVRGRPAYAASSTPSTGSRNRSPAWHASCSAGPPVAPIVVVAVSDALSQVLAGLLGRGATIRTLRNGASTRAGSSRGQIRERCGERSASR